MDSPLSDIKIGHVTSRWAENNQIFVRYQPSMDSTNALAKKEAFTERLLEESLSLYVADHQTAGRGRGSKTWTSAQPGSALLCSWSYLLGENPQPTTSCRVGLAVYRAGLASWPFLPWSLKAPNDIYIGNKKVAGILLESVLQDQDVRLIIGLGLNVTAAPGEETMATSLVQSLPPGLPLLGQDYLSFLDRLMFELTDAVSYASQPLSLTDQACLITALNQFPLLKEKYTAMDSDGSLYCQDKKINWTEL